MQAEPDTDVYMTAFCLIAMQEASPWCSANVQVSIIEGHCCLHLLPIQCSLFKVFFFPAGFLLRSANVESVNIKRFFGEHIPYFLSLAPQGMPDSRRRAASYIEGRLQSLTSPYAVAVASYALANEGKFNREVLYRFVSRGV